MMCRCAKKMRVRREQNDLLTVFFILQGEDWDPPPAYEGDDDEFGGAARHRHHSDDYHPQSQRRVAGPPLDRYGPERSDRDSHRADRDLSRVDRDPPRMDRDSQRMDRDSQRMDRDLQPQRIDRDLTSRPNDQLSSRSSARARPNPPRAYLDDGPAYGGYGGGNGPGPRGYVEDGPSGYEGGGGGLTRSQSSSQGRSHHPEGRSMVRRPDGPVVRR